MHYLSLICFSDLKMADSVRAYLFDLFASSFVMSIPRTVVLLRQAFLSALRLSFHLSQSLISRL